MTEHVITCVTVATCVAIAAYVALLFLREFRTKNDVMDKLLAFVRENEERWGINNTKFVEFTALLSKAQLDIESLDKRHENLLGSQERLVARFGELDASTRKDLNDLATKWLAEVQNIQTTQSALFNQRPAPRPRFSP